MTTLLFVQRDGDVEIGWDSMVTNGGEGSTLASPKVFARGGVVYGPAGVLEAQHFFQYVDGIPEYNGGDPEKWLAMVWAPAVREMLEEYPALKRPEPGESHRWEMAVAVGGVAFQIDGSMYPVREMEGVYAVGSGAEYAKGALFAGASVMDALQVAARLDLFTGGPITVGMASKIVETMHPAEQVIYSTIAGNARQPQHDQEW